MSLDNGPGRAFDPYGEQALNYRAKGWFGVLPIPYKAKKIEIQGWHGKEAKHPTKEQVQQWMKQANQQNICIRLAGVDNDDGGHEILGIDVDHYSKGDKPKTGGNQLAELEAVLGELPDTWICTARTDGVSGIRYFRVPRGLEYRGKVDKDIEVISKGNRYSLIWPSVHPDLGGDEYWFYPPGVTPVKENRSEWFEHNGGEIPDARKLIELPEKWVDYLSRGRVEFVSRPKDNEISLDALEKWAEEAFFDAYGNQCSEVQHHVAEHKQKIDESSSLHDKVINIHWNLYKCGLEGHHGVMSAVKELEHYVRNYALGIEHPETRKRWEKEIDGEIFRSGVGGGLRKIKAMHDDMRAKGAHAISCLQDRRCTTGNSDGSTATVVPTKVLNERHNGQLRMAYRFAEGFDGKLIFIHGIDWHYWDGKRWARDDRGKAYRAVLTTMKIAWAEARKLSTKAEKNRLIQAVKACESSSGISGVLAIASKLKQFARTVNDLDQDPYLLNVQNGTLNLNSMTLQPHDPEDMITKVCKAAYRPELVSNVWSNFLEKVLPDAEVRSYLQRICGVALLGMVREHLLIILTGEGRNGKSTFYEAVLHAMGDYGGTAEPDLLMHREGAHPTGQMALRGLRLAVVSESERNRRLAEATTRRLVGGDPITARFMHKDFVEFLPSHLLMLITNHLPQVSGDDPATWARMRVIPFNVVIPQHERDLHMPDKLKDEADAVLTWTIQGWEDYCQQGTAEPWAVQHATDAYQKDSDDVGAFIMEECVTGIDAQGREATTSQLHAEWEKWQKENGCAPMGQREFGRALDKKGHMTLPAVNGKRLRQGIGRRLIVISGGRIAEQS